MEKRRVALACLTLLAAAVAASADEAPEKKGDSAAGKENPAHNEIRKMRDEILQAIEKKDVDALIKHLHPDVVLTVQEGDKLTTIRKHDGVRGYLDRTFTGPNAPVKSYNPKLDVDELTILHGDSTGIAFGSSVDHYVLADGSEFDVPTRWSATLVKHDGEWKVANLQVSSNPFDNPVLLTVKRRSYWFMAAAAAAGMLVGVLVMMLLRRSKAAANP